MTYEEIEKVHKTAVKVAADPSADAAAKKHAALRASMASSGYAPGAATVFVRKYETVGACPPVTRYAPDAPVEMTVEQAITAMVGWRGIPTIAVGRRVYGRVVGPQ